MAVWYQELEDSPQIDMDRDGGSARRTVNIANDDLGLFLAEVFPDPWLGYADAASFPGLPWLIVQKVHVSPFDPARPTGLGELMNTYPAGWKVQVDYGRPKADLGFQGGPNGGRTGPGRGDHSGPGGGKGSAGNQHDQDLSFVSHKVSVGGEFLTWQSHLLQWETAANGLDVTSGKRQPEKQYTIQGDVTVGIVMPHIQHHITWHYVLWPPWAAIRQSVGKINAYTFAGAPPGTLLFLGAEASIDFTSTGTKAWTLEYKYSEKNMNAVNPRYPMGWQYFLRPDGVNAGTYQPVLRRIPPRQLLASGPGPGFAGLVGIPNTTLTGIGNAWISVAHADDFPKAGQFRVVIDPNNKARREEVAVVPSAAGWACIRGINGRRSDHAPGAMVVQSPGRLYDLADFRYLYRPGIPL